MSISNLKAAAEYASNVYRQSPDTNINIQARYKGIVVRGFNKVGSSDRKAERIVPWSDADDSHANLILLAVQDVEQELENGSR